MKIKTAILNFLMGVLTGFMIFGYGVTGKWIYLIAIVNITLFFTIIKKAGNYGKRKKRKKQTERTIIKAN